MVHGHFPQFSPFLMDCIVVAIIDVYIGVANATDVYTIVAIATNVYVIADAIMIS